MMTIDSFLICILFCFYEYCRKSKHETPTKVSSEKVRAALQSQNAPQDRKPSLSGIGNSSSSKVMTASLEKPDRKPILIGKLVTEIFFYVNSYLLYFLVFIDCIELRVRRVPSILWHFENDYFSISSKISFSRSKEAIFNPIWHFQWRS